MEKNTMELKINRTIYVVEAKNVEKSSGSADSAFKRIVSAAASKL